MDAGSALSAPSVIEFTAASEHQEEDLAALGRPPSRELPAVGEELPRIGDVRGQGLMLGVELVGVGKTPATPATPATERIPEGMRDRGVFVGKTGPGRNVVAFQTPPVIERADLDGAVGALRECLEEERDRPG